MHEHARRHVESHPLASEAILENTYIDDTFVSVQSDEKAMEFKNLEKEERVKARSNIISASVSGINRLEPSRFSSWNRLIRVVAWILKFKSVGLKKESESKIRAPGVLSVGDIDKAEKVMLHELQSELFKPDLTTLAEGSLVNEKSAIAKLCPFIDQNGLLRASGRLEHSSQLSYDEKHPNLIPHKHAMTHLIIGNRHDDNDHAALVNNLMSQVARKYWCVGLREAYR